MIRVGRGVMGSESLKNDTGGRVMGSESLKNDTSGRVMGSESLKNDTRIVVVAGLPQSAYRFSTTPTPKLRVPFFNDSDPQVARYRSCCSVIAAPAPNRVAQRPIASPWLHPKT